MENKSLMTVMKSIKYIYKAGYGPSSSHTMGPAAACTDFFEKNTSADSFKVILYGSLAKTGRGHGTDAVIKKCFHPKKVEIVFDEQTDDIPHPNTMDIFALKDGVLSERTRVMSVGGGSIEYENGYKTTEIDNTSLTSFKNIAEYCENNNITLWEYVIETEENDIVDYLSDVWKKMKISIENGLKDTGELPGGLGISKKAKYLYSQRHIDESSETAENRRVCSYAFAVSEQNASGEQIVTAPTCGASGVVPAVLYYFQQKRGYTDDKIVEALGVGGLIGNLVKHNASISGAECGCQAEIGTACAMASAALGQLFGLHIDQIEYAAEIAIEHHLGLTCDPIKGLVQIPCIERNAVAAMRAINAVSLANFLSDTRKISLDDVIKTMKETGINISGKFRETSEGGLAKISLS